MCCPGSLSLEQSTPGKRVRTNKGRAALAPGLQERPLSEGIAQCELHDARPRDRLVVVAEASSRVNRRTVLVGVKPEADGIGDVVDVIRKRKALPFRNVPALAQRHVYVEISLPPEIISIPRLSRVGKPEGRIRRPRKQRSYAAWSSRRCESVRISVGIRIQPGLDWGDLHRVPREFPVRREFEAVPDGKGEPAGPPVQTRPTPPAEHRLHGPAPIIAPFLPVAKGELVHPVGVDLVGGIVIGDRAVLAGLKGVVNLAGQPEFVLEAGNTLRVGTHIKRFGINVIKVPLQPVGYLVPDAELPGVVIAPPDALPRIQGWNQRH